MRRASVWVGVLCASMGLAANARYIHGDPIGMEGGLNRFIYAEQSTLVNTDPTGLFVPSVHNEITRAAMSQTGFTADMGADVGARTAMADFLPGSQVPENSHWHAMRDPKWTREEAQRKFWDYLEEQIKTCELDGLARALHAAQDSAAYGHKNFAQWRGSIRPEFPKHLYRDAYPTKMERQMATEASVRVIERFKLVCSCP